MKVLIDENLPERLHKDFIKNTSFSVAFMGWRGKENGDLVQLMIANDIKVLVTLDKNLQYQQNFQAYPVIVIVIHAVRTDYPFIKPLVQKIEMLLESVTENGVYVIEQN